MSVRVLIVEDAPEVARTIAFAVRMAWPDGSTEIAHDGATALARFAANPPDLVVLDVGLPGADGFAVCRQVRERSTVPILVLTVREATVDKVRALGLGADDYLTKPFDHLELIARTQALHRRACDAWAGPGEAFVAGEVQIDFTTQTVRLRGEPVVLTGLEYRLLAELARHAGAILPHDALVARVWGAAWDTHPDALKVYIRRLRRKLGDDASRPRYIETIWGRGYRFRASSACS